jgi:ATP-dependent DNA helicase RecQ
VQVALSAGSGPQEVLESIFGYKSFRPGQREIIDAVLARRDCIGVMPTGAGKSLTFQIPAKLLGGTVLVVSPLISLMKDQVDALERNGFKAALFNSTLEDTERSLRLRQLRRGELELLYVAPEALRQSLRTIIADSPISLVVVDEAHCISHWGHDFRPAYRQLRDLKGQFGDIPVLALTATATRRVALDIVRSLGMRKPAGYKGSFYRPNLRIIAQKKGGGRNSRRDILNVIRAHRDESGIVYCASRRGVDGLTEWLSTQGVRALPYHAGLDDQTRARNQNAFARDEVNVVVATVAFGMGIDKSNVRFVVHRDMPRSIEAWYQEIGRAGRDGLASDCVVLYSWADVIAYDAFLDEIGDIEQRDETRDRTISLFRLLDRSGCRHQALVGYFDETIPACGQACEACLGLSLDDVFARAARPPRAAPAPSWRTPSWRTAEFQQAEAEAETNLDLFDRLRVLRRQIADSESVPAYIVFSDAVLREMSRRVPKNERELMTISGVGPAKLTRYGKAFLEVLCSGSADDSA